MVCNQIHTENNNSSRELILTINEPKNLKNIPKVGDFNKGLPKIYLKFSKIYVKFVDFNKGLPKIIRKISIYVKFGRF